MTDPGNISINDVGKRNSKLRAKIKKRLVRFIHIFVFEEWYFVSKNVWKKLLGFKNLQEELEKKHDRDDLN